MAIAAITWLRESATMSVLMPQAARRIAPSGPPISRTMPPPAEVSELALLSRIQVVLTKDPTDMHLTCVDGLKILKLRRRARRKDQRSST
jgi:hypothetical protein